MVIVMSVVMVMVRVIYSSGLVVVLMGMVEGVTVWFDEGLFGGGTSVAVWVDASISMVKVAIVAVSRRWMMVVLWDRMLGVWFMVIFLGFWWLMVMFLVLLL